MAEYRDGARKDPVRMTGIAAGDGLRGVGNIPRIAGQQPIFVVRQIYAFKNGNNNGPEA